MTRTRRRQNGGYGSSNTNQLPSEIVLRVGNFLPAADLVRAQRASRRHFLEHTSQIPERISHETLSRAQVGLPARPAVRDWEAEERDPFAEEPPDSFVNLIFSEKDFKSSDDFEQWISDNFPGEAYAHPQKYGNDWDFAYFIFEFLNRNLGLYNLSFDPPWSYASNFGKYVRAFTQAVHRPFAPVARFIEGIIQQTQRQSKPPETLSQRRRSERLLHRDNGQQEHAYMRISQSTHTSLTPCSNAEHVI